MKDTGIKWIGFIPNDWQLKKVKNCFYISKEQANDKNPTVLSLARSGIKVRDISTNEGQLAASYENYNPVQPGDLLLNPMDLYSGANCNMSEVNGVISPAYVNLRAKIDLNPKFFDYYFKTQYWAMAMFAHGKGVSFDNRWTMNADAILNYCLPFPKKETQDKVVSFLNKKMRDIDLLIDLENGQINSLKDYKHSLIRDIVFKGTNPNTSLKKSGVDWIGFIPSDWRVTQLKNLFDIIAGGTPNSGDPKNWDGNVRWITPADFKTDDVYIFQGRRNLSLEGLNSCSATLIPTGNIVFSKRAPIGSVVINSHELCTNQGCLSCIKKNEISLKYFYYQMSVLTEAFDLFGSGTTFKEISAQKFGAFILAVPSLDDQNKIVEFLDEKCEYVSKLIEMKQNKIHTLELFKKALIYECVTGKKEVAA